MRTEEPQPNDVVHASGVNGPPLLEGGAQGPTTRVVRPDGGIIAQLDEPVGHLRADAPRLLEAHPEDPLGGLVVEDHRFRGVYDHHRHEEITRQLADEDHLHGLLGHQGVRDGRAGR